MSDDVIVQLEEYFYLNGIQAEVSEVDENAPGAGKISQLPEIKRATQFIFEGNGLMPTMAMIGECGSAEDCRALAQKIDRPDATIAVAGNGNLLFFGLLSMGDADKIAQARKAFIGFKAQ